MPLEINLDNVVIGSSLEALLFAFYGKHRIIYTRNQKPDEIETLDEFGLGTSKKAAWEKHWFQLGIAGYLPFTDKVKHMRYVDANTLKVITHQEKVITVKFNKLYVFDDHEFLDLPPSLTRTSDKIKIVDWFHASKGDLHEHEIVESNNDFMNKVIFFKSGIHKDVKRKDVCVISNWRMSDIDKIREHVVKIKTEKLMKSLGIETARQTRVYIRIDHIRRDIIEYGKNIYDNFDNVEFIYDDAKFIFETNDRVRRKIDYMKYIRLKFGLK